MIFTKCNYHDGTDSYCGDAADYIYSSRSTSNSPYDGGHESYCITVLEFASFSLVVSGVRSTILRDESATSFCNRRSSGSYSISGYGSGSSAGVTSE